MIQFLGPALRKLFNPETPMDADTNAPEPREGIGGVLDAAVAAHVRAAAAATMTHEDRIRDVMDDLFERMGKTNGERRG